MVKNAFKHFKTIMKHKWVVFRLCLKCGIPWQGIVHDLSKFSPTEFLEGVKYYHYGKSPNERARKEKGYSAAWLHHKGRNKHHHEYWFDYNLPSMMPVMPYKYVVELICDSLAAGIVYQGENWHAGYQLEYWQHRKDKDLINKKVYAMVTEVLEQVRDNGIDKVLSKRNLQVLYTKFCLNNEK